MNAEQARAIVEAQEQSDRAMANLRNLTLQRGVDEQRIAAAGETYAAAKARLDEVLIHQTSGGTPFDPSLIVGAEDDDSVLIHQTGVAPEPSEPRQIEAPKAKRGRPRKEES